MVVASCETCQLLLLLWLESLFERFIQTALRILNHVHLNLFATYRSYSGWANLSRSNALQMGLCIAATR